MAFAAKTPVFSEILRTKTELTDDEPKKKSREEWKKAKELEEARKAGTAPAAVDEEGKDINPHIPQYISTTPWYYGASGPTLKHQRVLDLDVPKHSGIDEWYHRGVNEQSVAKKWRKGACENCGAMGHKKKECLERPRKIGAKYSNRNIAADEFKQPTLNQSYDGKRDRWAGYDPSQYNATVEEFQKVDEAKRQLRAEKLEQEGETEKVDGEGNNEDEVEDDEDEDKYVDDFDMPGTKVDSKQRITVRNLRIREDTAKYLRNLDPNSAYYDPKTRSMRDNPHKEKDPSVVPYAGENFIRFSGDTRKHMDAQLFAWEAHEKGMDVHLLAEPTRLELLQKDYQGTKVEYENKAKMKLIEKYGGEEHLEVPPKELLLAQTEDYREYTRLGKIVKGEEKPIIKSRYEEDVFPGNHTSVWGSFWNNGRWGYQCCHSLVKNSYCTGEKGKLTSALQPVVSGGNDKKIVPEKVNKEKIEDDGSSSSSSSSSSSDNSDSESSSSSSSSSSESDSNTPNKKKKMKSHKKKKTKISKDSKNGSEEILDERKRKYNSMYESKIPTEQEMEEYYKKRPRDFDPMN